MVCVRSSQHTDRSFGISVCRITRLKARTPGRLCRVRRLWQLPANTPYGVLALQTGRSDPVRYDQRLRVRHRARRRDGRLLRRGGPQATADRSGARHHRPGQRAEPQGPVRRLRLHRRAATVAARGLRGATALRAVRGARRALRDPTGGSTARSARQQGRRRPPGTARATLPLRAAYGTAGGHGSRQGGGVGGFGPAMPCDLVTGYRGTGPDGLVPEVVAVVPEVVALLDGDPGWVTGRHLGGRAQFAAPAFPMTS